MEDARISEMNFSKQCPDQYLSSLNAEKRELDTFLQAFRSKAQPEEPTHYSYIFPLVKDVHLLELKEKENKEEYENEKLYKLSQFEGQHLLKASLEKEATLLKFWHEELNEIKSSQQAVSITSVESQEVSTVHDVVYNCSYDLEKLIENLALTVLYQSIHIRIKIQTAALCSNIHFFSPKTADVKVNCDTHIPGLEEIVIELLKSRSSINTMISKVSAYIASDMAPFVISIPIRKTKKKKTKDSTNADGQAS